MVIIVESGPDDPSSNDEAVCISYTANTFGKGVDLTILPPVTDK